MFGSKSLKKPRPFKIWDDFKFDQPFFAPKIAYFFEVDGRSCYAWHEKIGDKISQIDWSIIIFQIEGKTTGLCWLFIEFLGIIYIYTWIFQICKMYAFW